MSLSSRMANLSLVPSVREEEHVPSQRKSTARPDIALEDDAPIKPDDIMELEDLASHAEKLLKSLLNDNRDVATLRGHLSGPGHIAQRLRHSKKKLDESKAKFGKQDYISLEVIHRALKSQAYDPVIHEANLAVLTTFIFTATHEKDQMFENLRALGQQFPGMVGESITADNFGLVLDLRTQTLIAALRKNKDEEHVSPVHLLHQIFYAQEEDPRPLLPFGGDMKYPHWREETEKRELELYGLLGHDDAERGLRALREKYPWDNFASKMAAYSRHLLQDPNRQARIAAAVDAVAGSFSQDAEQLDSPVLPEAKDKKIQPLPAPEEKATRREQGKQQIPRVSFRLGEIKALEQEEEELEELSPDEEEEEEEEMAGEEDHAVHLQVDKTHRPEHQQDRNDTSSPSPSGAELLNLYFEHARENNKENQAAESVAGPSRRRFIDPQPGAIRIEFDTQLEETQDPESRRSSGAAEKGQGKKRRRTLDEDEDDNEVFEADNRKENRVLKKRSRQVIAEADPWVQQHPIPVARSAGASLTRHSNVSARSRASAGSAARTSGVSVGQMPAGPSRVRRSNGLQNRPIRASNASSTARGSDMHRNELVPAHVGAHPRRSLSPQSEDDGLVSMVNKIEKLNRTANKRRGVRKGRNPWTEEQANMLVRMIGKYGTNWQLIAAEEPLLYGRTNVNLKDKARNMKLQFLRNGLPLPGNFEHVTISQKDRP
ncbi:hypothetical protein BZA05DRAFT_205576 [Tricharina praecox]|uniref:uncharacterized protein n=1 Tax=Tricharina praecox TaxID=43433 RepID=UPI0022207092|nr:uncharacterized protein BZA05DRAFT_205576 [Tricharina praecox]KAI5842301.1 hypothetical protein BZA05DRAFT_205576 [Tricharina praecox]